LGHQVQKSVALLAAKKILVEAGKVEAMRGGCICADRQIQLIIHKLLLSRRELSSICNVMPGFGESGNNSYYCSNCSSHYRKHKEEGNIKPTAMLGFVVATKLSSNL
jgi:hypothetical protein